MATLSFQQTATFKRSFRRAALPENHNERWAIVLAGGDGTRLRSMTRALVGDDRPKQFCPIVGGRTLLEQTLDRVGLSIPDKRTMLVVTEKHRRFYQPLTARRPKELLVEQPENKGTAPAILYALQRVAARSPKAIVALFPSDHYFADEKSFMSQVDSAYAGVQANPSTVTLLGITPAGPEVEYGWIEPQTSILSNMPGSITRVRRFWEKPAASVAQQLMERGCLWNSFVMVGRVDSLLRMTQRALVDLYDAFGTVVHTFGTSTEASAVRELYRRISETNFSQHVLASRPDDLAVMRVGEVGWSDLGEPGRVLSTLARLGMRTEPALSAIQ
ncbi:MAG TPA: sugar phosphate nucleotidyltransferase [Pyrinomonadaceae bacterium]|nr:sugar phosphate nucleotidyltransferase [Pyrinomonadaceae bacterium]